MKALPKSPTGIRGLDEITGGGLPSGRPTLVCGGAGCGKTLLAMEFLVRGAAEFGEPGVFMAFEETAEELAQNVASLGFDLKALSRAQEAARSTTSTSSAASSRRPASTTSKGSSSASGTPSTRIGASGSCSTPSRLSSPACRTRPSCAPNFAGSSAGSRTRGVTADHHRRAGRGHADPARPGGVRLRLRDLARPPRGRTGLDPAPAGRQVPRLDPRHERIPLPHR